MNYDDRSIDIEEGYHYPSEVLLSRYPADFLANICHTITVRIMV